MRYEDISIVDCHLISRTRPSEVVKKNKASSKVVISHSSQHSDDAISTEEITYVDPREK